MLKRVGVTHIVGLPDNSSAALFEAAEQDSTTQLITVTREGEAFAVASGLWIGGKTPIVVIQNTGLLESGDGLRGTAARMAIPLLIFVTCRGFARLEMVETGDLPHPTPKEISTRPDLDSVGFLTEPTLDAWNIPHARYASDEDYLNFEAMWKLALGDTRPTALVLTQQLG